MNQRTAIPSVIHEDNHIIVIDKPPRLATMGVKAEEDSLVTWTRAWLKQKYDKPGNVYLGVVSRLDAFTTGLIVLAKTSKAAGRLTKQFQSGEVEKKYIAILEDRPDFDCQLVDWIRKDDGKKRMVVVQNGQKTRDARRAELRYRVLGYDGPLTLVEVDLLTGRKHQIRVQFASRDTPVLGDKKYGGTGNFRHGIALQSSSLKFEHPVRREEMSFRIGPPDYWNLARFTVN